MAQSITALFETRREAETSVERLTQKHGVDRSQIQIEADEDSNTAGTRPAGADVEGGHEKTETAGEPALRGQIKVLATVDDEKAQAVTDAFQSCGASEVTR